MGTLGDVIGARGELLVNGPARGKLMAMMATALVVPQTALGIQVDRRGGRVRLSRAGAGYYGSPSGTLTVRNTQDADGALRLSGVITSPKYTGGLVGTSLASLTGGLLLLFGSGTENTLILGWVMLVMFGLAAALLAAAYPATMRGEIARLQIVLSAPPDGSAPVPPRIDQVETLPGASAHVLLVRGAAFMLGGAAMLVPIVFESLLPGNVYYWATGFAVVIVISGVTGGTLQLRSNAKQRSEYRRGYTTVWGTAQDYPNLFYLTPDLATIISGPHEPRPPTSRKADLQAHIRARSTGLQAGARLGDAQANP